MYSDGLLKLPIFTIQKNFKILLTVYSLSPQKMGFRPTRLLQPRLLRRSSGIPSCCAAKKYSPADAQADNPSPP